MYHESVGCVWECRGNMMRESEDYDGKCEKNTVRVSDLYDESVGCVP